MKYNILGRTGLHISQLGFGCGSIGGLLVRGDYPTMRRVVSCAIELGINYFDTAPQYGNGQSEVNLGAVLRELKANVLIGTKVRLTGAEMGQIGAAISRSVEGSLRRLGRATIDLIQLHNRIGFQRQPEQDQDRVGIHGLDAVMRAFEMLQQQGKIRFWGITGLGASDGLHEAVATGGFQAIQVPYNLLNPSAGTTVPPSFPFQDYRQLIDHAAQKETGVIAIRILAGGALSGTTDRHPIAAQSVNPIASEQAYSADVARVQRYTFLVEDGVVSNLVESAIRFVVSKSGVSTALLGISSRDQLEQAVKYVERGPLSVDTLRHIRATWSCPE
ncbi:MAG: aldo/keto reductase [Deltaproteobacteria bacterium]|nr:aldo/keto reductase [Deltaproteobacteria bacterium]MDO9210303.1 aldo/keto reductase [Deltaproteobacteria bacterium]